MYSIDHPTSSVCAAGDPCLFHIQVNCYVCLVQRSRVSKIRAENFSMDNIMHSAELLSYSERHSMGARKILALNTFVSAYATAEMTLRSVQLVGNYGHWWENAWPVYVQKNLLERSKHVSAALLAKLYDCLLQRKSRLGPNISRVIMQTLKSASIAANQGWQTLSAVHKLSHIFDTIRTALRAIITGANFLSIN